ncbi:hypothetical protein [Domibacillus epiphyticus]|nr:hypothetical protein [Domibacillus epiphyticus]
MTSEDYTVAQLSSEQTEKLKQFEGELGYTLIAYEDKHDSGNQTNTSRK